MSEHRGEARAGRALVGEEPARELRRVRRVRHVHNGTNEERVRPRSVAEGGAQVRGVQSQARGCTRRTQSGAKGALHVPPVEQRRVAPPVRQRRRGERGLCGRRAVQRASVRCRQRRQESRTKHAHQPAGTARRRRCRGERRKPRWRSHARAKNARIGVSRTPAFSSGAAGTPPPSTALRDLPPPPPRAAAPQRTKTYAAPWHGAPELPP